MADSATPAQPADPALIKATLEDIWRSQPCRFPGNPTRWLYLDAATRAAGGFSTTPYPMIGVARGRVKRPRAKPQKK